MSELMNNVLKSELDKKCCRFLQQVKILKILKILKNLKLKAGSAMVSEVTVS